MLSWENETKRKRTEQAFISAAAKTLPPKRATTTNASLGIMLPNDQKTSNNLIEGLGRNENTRRSLGRSSHG